MFFNMFHEVVPCFAICLKKVEQLSPNAKPGEYTALCAAGVMSFEDGLKLVKLRGEAMQEAATSLSCTVRGVCGVFRVRGVSVVRCAVVRSGFSGISEYLRISWNPWILSAFCRILSDSLLALVGGLVARSS